MRPCRGIACELPSGLSQLPYVHASTAAVLTTWRGSGSAVPGPAPCFAIARVGHSRAAESESRSSTAGRILVGGASAPHSFNNHTGNHAVLVMPDARCQARPTDAVSSTIGGVSESVDPLLSDFLLDQFQFHRAPDGMADRIAAASERHASRQQRLKQGQNLPAQLGQHGLHHPSQPKSSQGTTHDPESCRFWEARLLSRACQSLAFHISSHFHIPMGPLDPLASVLSSVTFTPASAATASASITPALIPLSAPLLPPLPSLQARPNDASSTGQLVGDQHGIHDNLPAVFALKAVASSLVDSALWRMEEALPSPDSRAAPSPSSQASGVNVNSDEVSVAGPPTLISAGAAAAASAASAQSPHSEAPSAVTALIHIVASSLVRLSHACGHSGCFSLAGPSLAAAAVAIGTAAGTSAASLSGLPFSGRQLARLYEMASAAATVDAGALAGVPASTAASVLLLLAAAQPPLHPAISEGFSGRTRRTSSWPSSAASMSPGGVTPSVPAALLARYLHVGCCSPGHNPLDTVRVMWALLRLQLPDAGSLRQPSDLEPTNSSSRHGSSNSSSSGGVFYATDALQDAMAQLARILTRQLQNRDRALSVLRSTRPGELCGTLQLAVQAMVLLLDRALMQERSAAALVQLDSALALLEATLTGSGSRSGSGLPSGSNLRAESAAEGSGIGSDLTLDPWHEEEDGQQDGRSRADEKAGRSGFGSSLQLKEGSEGAVLGSGPLSAAADALQSFLELCKEASAARDAARSFSGIDAAAAEGPASALRGDFPLPAWDLVPWSVAEWRSVLGDTEQRAALLMSTLPELGRLVEPQQPQIQIQIQQISGVPRHSAAEPKCDSVEGGTAELDPALGTAAAEPTGAVQRRRLRIHLQSYSALHFRTLESLYRAVKAQAPDATLLAPLSDSEELHDVMAAAASTAANSVATLIPLTGTSDDAARSAEAVSSRRILNAIALPYSAAVDMVFTDARGRRVGLCLAHLGASRRAPGELAILQHALAGWPEPADAVAVGSLVAAPPPSDFRAAPPSCAHASALARDEPTAPTMTGGDASTFEMVGATSPANAANAAAAAVASSQRGYCADADRNSALSLDDVVVLELDHDWFHLRESYYDHVRKQNKWDSDVRLTISMAMSYIELPWEARLDMIWYALAKAGVELPIRLFA